MNDFPKYRYTVRYEAEIPLVRGENEDTESYRDRVENYLYDNYEILENEFLYIDNLEEM